MTRTLPHAGNRRFPLSIVLAGTVSLVLLLSACTPDPLAEQYREGSGKNYIAGDGTVTEIVADQRGEPVAFSGQIETGDTVASTDYAGQVMVLNFWYAGCAPCRAEAPDLQSLSETYQDKGVKFLGVNVRDQVGSAEAFAKTYGITYPSILDTNTGAVQLAFSGTVAPNAVPTTLVLDKQGRVASRILGRIPDASILDTLIRTALDEETQP